MHKCHVIWTDKGMLADRAGLPAYVTLEILSRRWHMMQEDTSAKMPHTYLWCNT